MKVIINSPNPPRRDYSNLPEREPSDRLRERLEQQRLGLERLERERSEAERSEGERSGENFVETSEGRDELHSVTTIESDTGRNDFLENFLTDNDAEHGTREESASWKHSRRAPIVFVLALGLLAGVWYFAVHFESALPLERIAVRGTALLSDGEVVALAAIDPKERFYDIDLKKVRDRILRHSFIKSAHPRRDLNPSTIVLEIEERQPVAMLRSESTGEAFIVDRDGLLLRPKLIAGLRDPGKLMQVPLLTGVNERDTVGFQAMARLVATIGEIDSGELRSAIGEIRRTPTGAYILYTAETQTPIFIGSPFDVSFRSTLDSHDVAGTAHGASVTSLFSSQLHLLARVWKGWLRTELRTGGARYVDARFNGQIVLKRSQTGARTPLVPASSADRSRVDEPHTNLLTSAAGSISVPPAR